MIIIEKYKKWDYIDNHGYYVWINKYGDIIKETDSNGNLRPKLSIYSDLIHDLNGYHGIDVEAELTAILFREINNVIVEQMVIMSPNDII